MINATVVLTRYNESNKIITPCLSSLSNQKNINLEILFLDQTEDAIIKKLCKTLSNKNIKIKHHKIAAKSLSYARNIGINLSKTKLVLFIDSDAIPQEDWAFELVKSLEFENVGAVGSKSIPLWKSKPKWYNKTLPAKEVYSLFDLGNKTIKTKRVVGVGFGINKKIIDKESYFNEKLGRRPGSLLGGEETDLCNRIRKIGLDIYYVPSSVVQHQIQTNRMGLGWLINRFFYGGIGKAYVGGTPEVKSKKYNMQDKIFVLIISLPYLVGYLYGRLKKC
nr:hypothetical protein [Nanoarchaeum sp.]